MDSWRIIVFCTLSLQVVTCAYGLPQRSEVQKARQDDDDDTPAVTRPTINFGAQVAQIITGALMGNIDSIIKGSLGFIGDANVHQISHNTWETLKGNPPTQPTTRRVRTRRTTTAAPEPETEPAPVVPQTQSPPVQSAPAEISESSPVQSAPLPVEPVPIPPVIYSEPKPPSAPTSSYVIRRKTTPAPAPEVPDSESAEILETTPTPPVTETITVKQEEPSPPVRPQVEYILETKPRPPPPASPIVEGISNSEDVYLIPGLASPDVFYPGSPFYPTGAPFRTTQPTYATLASLSVIEGTGSSTEPESEDPPPTTSNPDVDDEDVDESENEKEQRSSVESSPVAAPPTVQVSSSKTNLTPTGLSGNINSPTTVASTVTKETTPEDEDDDDDDESRVRSRRKLNKS